MEARTEGASFGVHYDAVTGLVTVSPEKGLADWVVYLLGGIAVAKGVKVWPSFTLFPEL